MKFKSIIVAILFVFALAFANDAKAQLSVGGGLAYPIDLGELGIFARGVYDFDETWGGMGTFTYYLDGTEGVSFWSLDFDATYTFASDGPILYALAGLSILNASVDFGFGSASSSDTGISLGGGAKFPSGSITPFGEVRLRLANGSDFVIAGGILIPIN